MKLNISIKANPEGYLKLFETNRKIGGKQGLIARDPSTRILNGLFHFILFFNFLKHFFVRF